MNNPQKTLLENEIIKLSFSDARFPLKRVNSPQSHQQCMQCGTQAELGLKLIFYTDQMDVVWTSSKGTIHQQGYQGIVHGGFIAALLDAAMCHAVFNKGEQGVTGDISIRYLSEIALNTDLIIRSRIVKSNSTLFKVEAQIYVEQQLMAQSTARFIKR